MATQQRRRRRNARRSDPSFPDPRPAIRATLSAVMDGVRVETNVPVRVVGTPGIRWMGNLATTVTVVSPTIVDLTFAEPVTIGAIEISANDPAIRSRFGGFIEVFQIMFS